MGVWRRLRLLYFGAMDTETPQFKENITSVILMGGHSRVPMIQAAVRELVGEWVTLLSFIFTSAEPPLLHLFRSEL